MNKPLSITAFVDAETLRSVEQAAEDTGRSVEEFAAEAIRRAAAHEERRTAESVRRGRAALAAGDYVSHTDMVARLRAIITERTPD